MTKVITGRQQSPLCVLGRFPASRRCKLWPSASPPAVCKPGLQVRISRQGERGVSSLDDWILLISPDVLLRRLGRAQLVGAFSPPVTTHALARNGDGRPPYRSVSSFGPHQRRAGNSGQRRNRRLIGSRFLLQHALQALSASPSLVATAVSLYVSPQFPVLAGSFRKETRCNVCTALAANWMLASKPCPL